MRLSRLLLPLLAAVLIAGCEAQAPQETVTKPVYVPPPPSASEIQAQFDKTNPGARVGHVAAVNSANKTTAVAGIPVALVHKEDSIQFLDSSLNVIANGTVSQYYSSDTESSFLIVDYVPTATGRAPRLNDLAVYLPPR